MGSMGTYNSYRDCSLGICSIYCPQFCYFIFPPPPPSDDDSSNPFSPLIIAIIGVLASAFLLVSYYTIVTRFCRRGGRLEREENRDEIMHDQWPVGSTGLDEAMIKTITVFRYKRDEGLVEGTECSVCLSEFQENECLRLLPKCSHAFHLPCIDTWLKSHSNCPLCRANVACLAQPLPASQSSSHVGVHSYEAQRPNDLVLVVDDRALDCHDHVVVDGDNADGDDTKTRSDQESVEQFRRSSSLGAVSSQQNLLISDVLKIEEMEKDESWRDILGMVPQIRDIGSSKGLAMKRSNSTGKFMFIDHDKGKNVLIPH